MLNFLVPYFWLVALPVACFNVSNDSIVFLMLFGVYMPACLSYHSNNTIEKIGKCSLAVIPLVWLVSFVNLMLGNWRNDFSNIQEKYFLYFVYIIPVFCVIVDKILKIYSFAIKAVSLLVLTHIFYSFFPVFVGSFQTISLAGIFVVDLGGFLV